MIGFIKRSLLIFSLCASPFVFGNTWTGGVSASLPLGLGAEVGYNFLHGYLQTRGVVNYFPFHHTIAHKRANVYGDIRMLTAGGMLDYYPFRKVFRLTGGVLYNGNQLKLKVTPVQSISVNDRTYSTSEIGTVHIKLNYYPIAPYVAFGFDSNALKPGFSFTIDFGCIFQNDVKSTITSITGALAVNDTQEISDLNDYYTKFANSHYWFLRITPVLNIGFNWRW